MSWSHNIYCGNNGQYPSRKQYSPNAIPVTIKNSVHSTLFSDVYVRLASTPNDAGSQYYYDSVYAWTHQIDGEDVKKISRTSKYSNIYINPSQGLGFIVYSKSGEKSFLVKVNGSTVGTVSMSSSTSMLYTIVNSAIQNASSISIEVILGITISQCMVEITTS